MMDKQSVIVLQRSYLKPFTLQSDFARTNSVHVAELASRGLLTTHVGHSYYGRRWRVTAAGRSLLEITHGDDR